MARQHKPKIEPTPYAFIGDRLFRRDIYYCAERLAEVGIATVEELARDRAAGAGIAYHRLGYAILYSGADVIEHVERNRVVTQAERSLCDA